MEFVSTQEAPAAIGPYSQAVRAGDFMFCSGQVGIDPETNELAGEDIEAQTAQALKNLKAVLKTSELRMKNVVKTTVYLKNIDDFAAMNAVYAETFDMYKPARATVEVARLPLDALVEIECVAFAGSKLDA